MNFYPVKGHNWNGKRNDFFVIFSQYVQCRTVVHAGFENKVFICSEITDVGCRDRHHQAAAAAAAAMNEERMSGSDSFTTTSETYSDDDSLRVKRHKVGTKSLYFVSYRWAQNHFIKYHLLN